jgi:hypothetical protein
MRDWYFNEGGIYLSKRSRQPYFALKAQIQHVIDDVALAEEPDKQIGDDARKLVLAAASRLRTRLADDIRTRTGPWL